MNDMSQKLKAQLDDLIKHADDLEDEKADLRKALALLREKYQHESEKIQAHEDLKQSSIQSLESISAEKARLVRQVDELASNLSKSEERRDDMVRAKAALEDKLRSHESELARLRMQHDSQLSEMRSLNSEVSMCRKTHPDEIQKLTGG